MLEQTFVIEFNFPDNFNSNVISLRQFSYYFWKIFSENLSSGLFVKPKILFLLKKQKNWITNEGRFKLSSVI